MLNSSFDADINANKPPCNLRCHEQNFEHIKGAAAKLACEGHIHPQLRMRSPVYYWRHAQQAQARHESICTTKQGRWWALTFGTHGHHLQKAHALCQSAVAATPQLDGCIAQGVVNLTQKEKARLGISGSFSHILNGTRGFGYWKWKPWVIQRFLQSGEAQAGDTIVWLDRDLQVGPKSLAPLFCIGQNVGSGVAGFHSPCLLDRAWTKRELVLRLQPTDEQLDTVTTMGGLLVLRKTSFTERLIADWLELGLTGAFEDPIRGSPQDPTFVEHRHDQAALSLLMKQRGVKTFPAPVAAHDGRDIWAWEAGFCSIDWPIGSGGLEILFTTADLAWKFCHTIANQTASPSAVPPSNDFYGYSAQVFAS